MEVLKELKIMLQNGFTENWQNCFIYQPCTEIIENIFQHRLCCAMLNCHYNRYQFIAMWQKRFFAKTVNGWKLKSCHLANRSVVFLAIVALQYCTIVSRLTSRHKILPTFSYKGNKIFFFFFLYIYISRAWWWRNPKSLAVFKIVE